MNKILSIFLSILIFLLLATVFYIMFTGYQPSIQNISNMQSSPSLNQVQESSHVPLRLIIPSINVDAKVDQVGLAADGSVDVPKGPDDVAWFKLGPTPGATGSAVITGHYGPWKNGAHSVFDNLNQLKPGDIVQVKDDQGKTLSFTVLSTHVYNPDETVPEIFNKTDAKYLNLITCHGDWLSNQKTFTQRLVIFTKMNE